MPERAPDETEALQPLLDVLLQLAAGNADARLPAPEGDDPLAQITVALNLFADELALARETELERSRQLEQKITELERSQELVAQQNQAILELSTPVLEIWRGVLALPIIGLVNAERGEQITSQLLETISRTGARTVIIDLTGLAALDTLAAHKLLGAVSATNLLGAQVILTGISPENARTLVGLGLDFEGIATARTLEAGLAQALGRAR